MTTKEYILSGDGLFVCDDGLLIQYPHSHFLQGEPIQIAVGLYHTHILTSSNNLYSFGDNEVGQLGIGINKSPIELPLLIVCFGEVKMVKCGHWHSLALLLDGRVFAWGSNEYGQLGVGHPSNKYNPTQVTPMEGKITQIDCGGNFSGALRSDGVLFCWGGNEKGQIGNPSKIENLSIVQFSCGFSHVLALTQNGDLYGWGNNDSGQLGIGNTRSQFQPTKIISIPTMIDKIGCGSFFSMALLRNGSLYSWGQNTNGELGITPYNLSVPTKIESISDRIIEMNCGWRNAMVITSSYDLYCWGLFESQERDKILRLPEKLQFIKKGPFTFEKNWFDVIMNWSFSQEKFSIKTQMLVEETLLLLNIHKISKDISTYFIKLLLMVLYSQ
eukprot:TRINITY_DN9613_c3_g4_i1.p1 TRINITY_DN9613_c3_g4~~TRINITY_DN9613_c3_g4_i1.p1  ORF type:complete len:386 (-),score=78.10 TRINITY_DN9613_c3_g4_i1:11-1168(-)